MCEYQISAITSVDNVNIVDVQEERQHLLFSLTSMMLASRKSLRVLINRDGSNSKRQETKMLRKMQNFINNELINKTKCQKYLKIWFKINWPKKTIKQKVCKCNSKYFMENQNSALHSINV